MDVTDHGGFDAISFPIAGRFADERRPASKCAIGTNSPSERIRHPGKVALLTSDVPISAGETFSLAMRARADVVLVGDRIRRALSG